MALVPLIDPWQRNKDGTKKLDGSGKPVPNPDAGKPKPRKDWTEAEVYDHEKQLEHFDSLARLRAAHTLDPIRDAQKLVG